MARNILVTGTSTGIGEACVRRFASLGWRVFAGVRREEDGERLRSECGDTVLPVRLDVAESEQIGAAAERVAREAGADGLHGVVNNAGVAIAGPLEFLPISELRRQLEINVIGQVAVTQAMLPLVRRAVGRVVFIGSISGRSALPITGAYAASKFALEAIADALRVELQPWGMHVSIVEPGVIRTPIWDTALTRARRMRDEAPPELDRYYGSLLAGVERRAANAAEGVHGRPVSDVADVVEHALTAAHPRARYVIGTDARIRLFINALLPTRWRDALIVRRMAKL
jgi:NAD(P)-dependent dehydrogenase (short-subunit alcohol dehydrogenase family)